MSPKDQMSHLVIILINRKFLKITYFHAIMSTVRKGDEKSPKIKVFNWGSFSWCKPKAFKPEPFTDW